MSKVGSKRGREIEDEEDRVTKKSKYDKCDINVLPEELLIQILARVPKKNIDTLSEVSSQWLQITRSRNFWKTSCQLKWTTMVASDNLDFNREEYLVPTVAFNGKTLVDWQFYYKVRAKIDKATRAIAKNIGNQEGFHPKVSKSVAKLMSMGSELRHSNFIQFLETLPVLAIQLELAEYAAFVVPAVDLVCDMALLRCIRGDIDWFKATVKLLSHLVEAHKPRAKLFSLCQRTFDLCQMVRDKHPDMILSLVLVVIHLFKAMTPFDERSKKLFTLFTEYLIQLGPLDLGEYDEESTPDMIFRYPFSGQDPEGLEVLMEFSEINESTIPFEVAIQQYYTSDDWKVKASAVAVGLRLSGITHEYMEKYCALAIHAAKQSEQHLAFSGIVGLYNLVKKADETVMKAFNKEQAVEVFELFADAITRYDSTLGLPFIGTPLRMLNVAMQSEWISDELLERFITNVLNALAQLDANENLPHPEDDCVYFLSRIGKVFKGRIANKLDRIKAALFDLAKNERFKPARILECYVNLGAAVLEDYFVSDFRQLIKQIKDSTLPFNVDIFKCLGRFADVWFRYAESDSEREALVGTLLDAIPEEAYEFGQTAIFIESDLFPRLVPFPNTLAELLDEYKSAEVPKIILPVRHTAPKHHVPKEHLTPVNPKNLEIDGDCGDGLKQEIKRAYLYVSQLLRLVVYDNSKYVKYAQSVLNATLAVFRVAGTHTDLNSNKLNLHRSILDLLALVKPEMETREFVKYLDIIFDVLDDQTAEDMKVDKGEMSDLFSYGLGAPKSSTIERAINVYLFLYDFSTRELLEVHQFVSYCITTWPNNSYGGIHSSDLVDWLLIRIKHATSLDQMAPFLKTLTTIGVFYGVEFVLSSFEEFEESSPKECLASIMPHFRALYEAGTKGTIAMDSLELKYLRNFLILYAMFRVNEQAGEISMLWKVSPYNVDALSSVITKKSLETGVPELNELFSRLDLKGLCKELLLTLEDE